MITASNGGADCRPIEQEIARGRTQRDALKNALHDAPAVQKATLAWRIGCLNARLAQQQALLETFCLAAVGRQH